MRCYFNESKDLLAGLEQHRFLEDYGICIRNHGISRTPFGERWLDNARLAEVRDSGLPYYFDRISGGFQYQSLEGIGAVADLLGDDPRFLGFQAHEWTTSPLYDYKRIQKLILDKGMEINRASFAEYESRTSAPFFSGGDFSRYGSLYRRLHSPDDVRSYLRDYFAQSMGLTKGRIVSVNGAGLGYHTALELGANAIMAEIGAQVPLVPLQIACARGAARQHGKRFGFYYEPWGGRPFGCPCHTDFSTWFTTSTDPWSDPTRWRRDRGSTRQLHARLLLYAWLSGASYCAEEWGAENYFEDWRDYALTDYGRVMKSFVNLMSLLPAPEPVVPMAVVLPSGAFPLDLHHISSGDKVFMMFDQADACHRKMQLFSRELLGACHDGKGQDYVYEERNITSTPWIGTLDVFSGSVDEALLAGYGLVVFFDETQRQQTQLPADRTAFYSGQRGEAAAYAERISAALPFDVRGDVGSVQAVCGDAYLVGLFNNRGASRQDGKVVLDPSCEAVCSLAGEIGDADVMSGKEACRGRTADGGLGFEIPPGDCVLVRCGNIAAGSRQS